MITVELVSKYRAKFKALRNMEDLKEIREDFQDAYNLTDRQALGLLRENDPDKILQKITDVNKEE